MNPNPSSMSPQDLLMIMRSSPQGAADYAAPQTVIGAASMNSRELNAAPYLGNELSEFSANVSKASEAVVGFLDKVSNNQFSQLLGSGGTQLVSNLLQSPMAQDLNLPVIGNVGKFLGGNSVSAMHGISNLTQNAGFEFSGTPFYGPGEASNLVSKALYSDMESTFFDTKTGRSTTGIDKSEYGEAYSALAVRNAFSNSEIGEINLDIDGSLSVEIDESKKQQITSTVGKMADTLKSLQGIFTDKSFTEIADISERLTGIQMISPQSMRVVQDKIEGFASSMKSLGIDQNQAMQNWSQNTYLYKAAGLDDGMAQEQARQTALTQAANARRTGEGGVRDVTSDEIISTDAAFGATYGIGNSATAGAQREFVGLTAILDDYMGVLNEEQQQTLMSGLARMSTVTDPNKIAEMSKQWMGQLADMGITPNVKSCRSFLAFLGITAYDILSSNQNEATKRLVEDNHTAAKRAGMVKAFDAAMSENRYVNGLQTEVGNEYDISRAVTDLYTGISDGGQSNILGLLKNVEDFNAEGFDTEAFTKQIRAAIDRDPGSRSMSDEQKNNLASSILRMGQYEGSGRNLFGEFNGLTRSINNNEVLSAIAVAYNSGNMSRADQLGFEQQKGVDTKEAPSMDLITRFINGDSLDAAEVGVLQNKVRENFGNTETSEVYNVNSVLETARALNAGTDLSEEQKRHLTHMKEVHKRLQDSGEDVGNFEQWTTSLGNSTFGATRYASDLKKAGFSIQDGYTPGEAFRLMHGEDMNEVSKNYNRLIDDFASRGGIDLFTQVFSEDATSEDKGVAASLLEGANKFMASLEANPMSVEGFDDSVRKIFQKGSEIHKDAQSKVDSGEWTAEQADEHMSNYIRGNMQNQAFMKAMVSRIAVDPDSPAYQLVQDIIGQHAGLQPESIANIFETSTRAYHTGDLQFNPADDAVFKNFDTMQESIGNLSSTQFNTFLSELGYSEEKIAEVTKDDKSKASFIQNELKDRTGYSAGSAGETGLGLEKMRETMQAMLKVRYGGNGSYTVGEKNIDDLETLKTLTRGDVLRKKIEAGVFDNIEPGRDMDATLQAQENDLKELYTIQQAYESGRLSEEQQLENRKRYSSLVSRMQRRDQSLEDKRFQSTYMNKEIYDYEGNPIGHGMNRKAVDELLERVTSSATGESSQLNEEDLSVAQADIMEISTRLGEVNDNSYLNELQTKVATQRNSMQLMLDEGKGTAAQQEAATKLIDTLDLLMDRLNKRSDELATGSGGGSQDSGNFLGRLQIVGSDSVELVVNQKP